MNRRGFTLVEMIVALSLFTVMMVGGFFVIQSQGKRIRYSVAESRLGAELNYAMDNIKLYCPGASQIYTTFLHTGGTRSDLEFFRESNVYTITPSIITDNVRYRYYKNSSNNIVLRNGGTSQEEVIVGSAFNPEISFQYEPGFEPNFFTVTITGETGDPGNKKKMSKTVGVRLWYAGVVQ